MTNGQQSAGPTAANVAISESVSGSSPEARLNGDHEEPIKEDVEVEDDEVEQVARSIGVMKVENNK